MDQTRVSQVDNFNKANSVISRSSWGARDARIADKPESFDWNYDTVVIHHSGRSGDTSPISVQAKHMNGNGWEDVGYHYMVGPAGQIYEGRRLYYKGSHTELANTGKVGVLIMGNFESEFFGLLGGTPANLQIDTANRLIRSLKTLFPSLRTLGGHKDFKVKTECPGNKLYPLIVGMRTTTGLGAP